MKQEVWWQLGQIPTHLAASWGGHKASIAHRGATKHISAHRKGSLSPSCPAVCQALVQSVTLKSGLCGHRCPGPGCMRSWPTVVMGVESDYRASFPQSLSVHPSALRALLTLRHSLVSFLEGKREEGEGRRGVVVFPGRKGCRQGKGGGDRDLQAQCSIMGRPRVAQSCAGHRGAVHV